MNQEERKALTQQTTQRIVAGVQQTTTTASNAASVEETIRSLLTKYGREMYAAEVRTMEEWISRAIADLPIPIVITRTDHDPVLAYRWQTQDREGDGVTFAYCLEQALTHLMSQQRPS